MIENPASKESSMLYKFFSFLFTIGFFSAVIVAAYKKYKKIHGRSEYILGSTAQYHRIK